MLFGHCEYSGKSLIQPGERYDLLPARIFLLALAIKNFSKVILMTNIQYHKHGVGQNAFHFVWCPKYRIPVFRVPQQARVCHGVIRMIALQHGFKIHELKVMDDHIHLFMDIPPHISVSKAFQLVKGKSARILLRRSSWLRKVFRKGHLWSPGKFYRSVGSVTMDVIEHYIKHSNNNWNYYKGAGRNTTLREF